MIGTHKVSVIGAGQVGSSLAQRILESDLADVVLLDIVKNIAVAKALDLLDASPIVGHERTIIGTDDYRYIESSDIVVITAGLPRRPGMTREELISKNASIVKEVSANIKRYSPSSVVIVVTNPLDAMSYLAYKTTGFQPEKVIGMAGELDGGRLSFLIAEELKVPRSSVSTYVMGSHGDTMVPIISRTCVSGKALTELLPKARIDEIVKRSRDRGREIVELSGSGSAYYSPSAAVFKMIGAILKNTKDQFVVSAYLEGEYGIRDIYIGVPCILGSGGIQAVLECKLSNDEMASFRKSAQAIKDSIKLL